MNSNFRMGLDIGSTTVKAVVLDVNNKIIFHEYRRHLSNIKATLIDVLRHALEAVNVDEMAISSTGSGALMVSDVFGIGFVQEVIATTKAVEVLIPQTDVVIELGGEDAKIIYFSGNMEQRMNGTCAGGTGAFIDQMASLLQTDAAGLNELASKAKMIYPIASRCGVFAKTDIQPLLNEGADRANIALSIFQAVVNQTISGLACGRKIAGNVAFLGGPLHFLPILKQQFIKTLQLTAEEVMPTTNSNLYIAMGAALNCQEKDARNLRDLIARISDERIQANQEIHRLQPLFSSQEEIKDFNTRHNQSKVIKGDLATYQGKYFLGIDAGSTTTKLALVGDQGQLLHTYYANNEGNPLTQAIKGIQAIYHSLPQGRSLSYAAVTGYGENLIKSALKVDLGVIETVAHYQSAKYFMEDVDFILDIGGQDMKCIRVKQGVIDDIILNEACSSGCGSFLETFAKSLDLTIEEFAQQALLAKQPVDLGTRCTVFMNSRVKQAQKEGATVGDISAGLSYSVIRNALQKVIKIKSPSQLGQNIVVQGGTFYSKAVLRAFEIISGKQVVCPDIPGEMGAFGAALIALEEGRAVAESTLLSLQALNDFTVESDFRRCQGCSNNCLLTINHFNDQRVHITGNRCEIGAGKAKVNQDIPNLFQYKYQRVFDYQSLPSEQAQRGQVGIPRVLNMYENYPFWHRFFTELGYQVVLSPSTTKQIYEEGLETIPSESICYPAKLVHGHINHLVDAGLQFIFYPAIVNEDIEYAEAQNGYSCPIVTSYPETIKHNVDKLEQVDFFYPFIPFDNVAKLKTRLAQAFQKYQITEQEISRAVDLGWEERDRYQQDIRKKGEEVLSYLRSTGKKGIVLAGRPYHVDPEVSHGLDHIITGLGMAVLTEDSICHLNTNTTSLRILDQWKYHTRLYQAAAYVVTNPDVELVQLNSFGCGLDAVTSDQVMEILYEHNRIYTLIKIDEVSNVGAIRIRLRSLEAAMASRDLQDDRVNDFVPYTKIVFTEKMKKEHTILIPQMSPIHFDLIKPALKAEGFNVEIMPSVDVAAIDEGLTYVNNDACYPSIITTGQVMKALKSGKYDLDRVSVFMTQTGGPCRASNYVGFIRKALKDAGMEQVPVISVNLAGLESNPGFKITPSLINKGLISLVYGDVFQRVLYATRAYEAVKGQAQELYLSWKERINSDLINGSFFKMVRNVRSIVREFDAIERIKQIKPKVAIVGEILVKYHPTANNNLLEVLEGEGAEVVVPDLLDFFLYCAYNNVYKYKELSGSFKTNVYAKISIGVIEFYRRAMKKALAASEHFRAPTRIEQKASKAKELISLGNQGGEGWFLTGEMMELIEHGISNIVCVQPFACLPNHVMGKGMIKPLRRKYPQANIAAIDYDPGASEVNQINRIKLMMATAYKNLDGSI